MRPGGRHPPGGDLPLRPGRGSQLLKRARMSGETAADEPVAVGICGVVNERARLREAERPRGRVVGAQATEVCTASEAAGGSVVGVAAAARSESGVGGACGDVAAVLAALKADRVDAAVDAIARVCQ